jgi:hypothetical protein
VIRVRFELGPRAFRRRAGDGDPRRRATRRRLWRRGPQCSHPVHRNRKARAAELHGDATALVGQRGEHSLASALDLNEVARGSPGPVDRIERLVGRHFEPRFSLRGLRVTGDRLQLLARGGGVACAATAL